MDKGKTYAAAHKIALKHERAELHKDCISWDQYQRTMYRLVKEVGAKKATKPPADLDTRPYPPDVLIDKLGIRRAKGGSVPAVSKAQYRPEAAAELQRRVATLSRSPSQEVIPYASSPAGMPGISAPASPNQEAVEIAGVPSAFGYSGGFGTPGSYGVGQTQVPLYGGQILRARGGKAQADAAYIRTLQRMLQSHGYYHGAVDGINGPQTRAAMAAFQQASGGVPVTHAPPPLPQPRPPDFTGEAIGGPPGGPGAGATAPMARGTAQVAGGLGGFPPGAHVTGGGLAYPNVWEWPKEWPKPDPRNVTSWPPKPGEPMPSFGGAGNAGD
jgi:hypothetical protein